MSKARVMFFGKSLNEEVNVNPDNKIFNHNGKLYELSQLKLASPVTGTIYGTLLNYKDELVALGKAIFEQPYKQPPKAPILYIKPINTISGHGAPIPLPAEVSELEVGACLGVVIGRTATRVSEENALNYVEGFTVVNDVTIPHSSIYRPAISQKARDGFCPVGPWVVEREAVKDPDKLGVRVFINGELKQETTTANLIRPVSKLIADVTEFMTLEAGDVILVGVPENAPLVTAGDHIRIEITGVGSLDNHVVCEQDLIAGGVCQ
ncbi:fumarylacetoacetate hydrolase family protein [Neobacillus sp. OS1-32]|uniref:fumarylacetoacetate hydrolase family protein n=1 Tax=Neobacillus sp. OS1-32 TaxID=3070682 RepID=UPI0027DF00FD|nr:fumarylacetoacetate hydrolase family protein [Neobacillus sp. OS1-32]WML31766.1 fumarylacetoacetate hydrolase family protein [Neobacillus sp. OS1-32]